MLRLSYLKEWVSIILFASTPSSPASPSPRATNGCILQIFTQWWRKGIWPSRVSFISSPTTRSVVIIAWWSIVATRPIRPLRFSYTSRWVKNSVYFMNYMFWCSCNLLVRWLLCKVWRIIVSVLILLGRRYLSLERWRLDIRLVHWNLGVASRIESYYVFLFIFGRRELTVWRCVWSVNPSSLVATFTNQPVACLTTLDRGSTHKLPFNTAATILLPSAYYSAQLMTTWTTKSLLRRLRRCLSVWSYTESETHLFLLLSTDIREKENPANAVARDQSKNDEDDRRLYWKAPPNPWFVTG